MTIPALNAVDTLPVIAVDRMQRGRLNWFPSSTAWHNPSQLFTGGGEEYSGENDGGGVSWPFPAPSSIGSSSAIGESGVAANWRFASNWRNGQQRRGSGVGFSMAAARKAAAAVPGSRISVDDICPLSLVS